MPVLPQGKSLPHNSPRDDLCTPLHQGGLSTSVYIPWNILKRCNWESRKSLNKYGQNQFSEPLRMSTCSKPFFYNENHWSAINVVLLIASWRTSEKVIRMWSFFLRNKALNFGLVFETLLAVMLCYTPGLSTGLRMYPLLWVHTNHVF